MQYLSVSNVCVQCTFVYVSVYHHRLVWLGSKNATKKFFFTHFLYVHIVDKHTYARSYNFFTFFSSRNPTHHTTHSYHTPSALPGLNTFYTIFFPLWLYFYACYFSLNTQPILYIDERMYVCAVIFFSTIFSFVSRHHRRRMCRFVDIQCTCTKYNFLSSFIYCTFFVFDKGNIII